MARRTSANKADGGGRAIRIDAEVWEELKRRATPLRDTPNSTIRRLLGLADRPDGRRSRSDEGDGLVDENRACPRCGERGMDALIWEGDEVHCTNCGTRYAPSKA